MLGGRRLFQPLLRQAHHVVQTEAVGIGGLAVGCHGVDDLRQVLRQQATGLLRVDADCLCRLAEMAAQCVFNRARADRAWFCWPSPPPSDDIAVSKSESRMPMCVFPYR